MSQTPLIERAFQLAQSGLCVSKRDIVQGLLAENYPAAEIAGHLGGLAIQRQLNDLIKAALP